MNFKKVARPRLSMVSLASALALIISPLAYPSETDKTFQAGMEKAKVCATCHGLDGKSTLDAYPNLRGQNKSYLISALKDYKARHRTSGLAVVMQQQADLLSDQDIEELAHYYSQLESQPNQ